MNSRIFSLTSSVVAALLALSLSADDWDDALDDVGQKESNEQALATTVAKIRAEKGERFQFLPPPEGARLFTAEDFHQPASSNWKEKDGTFVSGGGRKGNISLRYRPSKKGIQYVWVYLLDWKREGKDKGSGELDVIATQGGSAAGTMKLLRCMSPLSTDAGVGKYGVKERPWPSYVWQDGFFEAESVDEVTLELAVKSGSYDVKAVVVTDDPAYEPRLADFFPMWLKVRAAKAQKVPATCSLYMRHGIDKSWFYKFPEPLKPGEDTGWFYCSRFLPYGKRTIQVTLDDGAKPAGDAEFEVFVSRTGRDDDILFRGEQKGGGNCKAVQFDPIVFLPADAKIAVDDDLSSSAKSLARAQALTAQRGAAPQAFEFQMNFGLSEKNGETFRNEDAARRGIGCRQIEGAPSPIGYYQTSYDRCICTPNRERIVKDAAKLADVKGPSVSWFMDEPGGAVTPGCPNCPKHFAAFLKEHGIKPSALGYKSAADVAPVFSLDASAQEKELPLRKAVRQENIALEDESDVTLEEKAPARLDPKAAIARYYWSRRYETTALRRFYAFATAEVEKHNPAIRTTATLSPDYIDKCNSVAHRIDYFDLFENGGLTFAQTEDWCNVADDYQVVGYLTDFFRGAARRRNLPVSIYDIMPMRDARTIATKAFAEIAHGARRINFWGYGPAYMVAEYSASDTPGLQAAIKSVTWPVGACEKTILGGTRAPGDVAYLYSVTTDILAGAPAAVSTDVRAASGGNASCGLERMWVDVLLTQSGYSTDILDENGVKDFLQGYRAAWTAEFNLRKDALAPLVDWVKAGGTLVLGPGALARDEYNRPLGFDEAVGLKREPFAYHIVKKNPEKLGDTVATKGLAKIASGKPFAAFASGRPAAYEHAVGKGRVIALSFSPGMSYWWNGKSNKGVYAPDLRNLVKDMLAKVPRTVWADDSRVEARLYCGAEEDVLVVANWAKDDLAKVTLTVPAGYRKAESFNSSCHLSGNELVLESLPAGDCVLLTAGDPCVRISERSSVAVKIAAEEFAKYWREVTGRCLATNAAAVSVEFAVDARLDGAHDEYRIVSSANGLHLVGANGRAVLYAVYDFFERQAGCRWFWDGDRVPKRKTISIAGLDVREKARFEYRGLRYFAHRGLTRFQAEHWGLEDWKREIDWCLKRRLNVMMPRIGMDDTWQKAYPEIVPYPDPKAPSADGLRGYDNRVSFWGLKYRGELRKAFTDYAFDREMIVPTDFGTMTHWYSRTPPEFLEAKNPPFLPQANNNYNQRTGLVWDIFQGPWLDHYWHLTETFVREGYGRPDYLHTIGLGERLCFSDRKKNLQMKKDVLARITGKALSAYPKSKILLAGWDFYCTWKPEEVRSLLPSLDPANTIIWDYACDAEPQADFFQIGLENDFTKWGVVGKFPYTFGIFLAYEQALDIRARYDVIEGRERIVRDDPMCKGYLLWPESSHTDVFLLRYFTANAWKPGQTHDQLLPTFCRDRYGESAQTFESVWRKAIPVSQILGWGGNWGADLAIGGGGYVPGRSYEKDLPLLDRVPEILKELAALAPQDEFQRRDAVDLARTVTDRALIGLRHRMMSEFTGWTQGRSPAADVRRTIVAYRRLAEAATALLGLHSDYSLCASLDRLARVAPGQAPHFDKILLDNAINGYCRSHQYEIAVGWYLPLLRELTDELTRRIEANERTEVSAEWFGIRRDALQKDLFAKGIVAYRPSAAFSQSAYVSALSAACDALLKGKEK